MQFGTNVLGVIYKPAFQRFSSLSLTEPTGHFYLTKLLLPALTETAKKAPAGTVRVVNLSSITHHYGVPEGVKWSTVGPGEDAHAIAKKLGATRLYNQSKLVRIY